MHTCVQYLLPCMYGQESQRKTPKWLPFENIVQNGIAFHVHMPGAFVQINTKYKASVLNLVAWGGGGGLRGENTVDDGNQNDRSVQTMTVCRVLCICTN